MITIMQHRTTEEQSKDHPSLRVPPRQASPVRLGRESFFSTLAGRRGEIERVIEQWDQLIGPALRPVDPPRILPFPNAAHEEPGSSALRIAVIRHGAGLGAALVRRLRVQLRVTPFEDMVIEEGYFLAPCAILGGVEEGKIWSINWNPKHIEALRRNFPVPLSRDILGARFVGNWKLPRRIVLIDTGDSGAIAQTSFDTEVSEEEAPVDHYGHGTAVGSLMRLIAPHAETHSYRVMRPDEKFVESPILLNAMAFAMESVGEYHIAVIPQRGILDARARGRDDIMQKIIRRNDARGYPTPIMVCAAGNDGPHEKMGYPAIIPGVIVAVAMDWSGRLARYNCIAPAGVRVHSVGALGGVEDDPLGDMARYGRPAKFLYGSSFATALVAGALASRD
jgi:hypothetical protein